jgi:hypothetical protein
MHFAFSNLQSQFTIPLHDNLAKTFFSGVFLEPQMNTDKHR